MVVLGSWRFLGAWWFLGSWLCYWLVADVLLVRGRFSLAHVSMFYKNVVRGCVLVGSRLYVRGS